MNIENFKIPIILGVTGHRDIDPSHHTKLKERLSEIYKSIIGKYPSTPIILLSPLADGADRIAVEVALSEEFKNKITISIPLPFDEKNYKNTFAKGLTNYKSADAIKKIELEEISISKYNSLIKNIKEQKNDYIPKTIPMLFDQESYENATDDEKRIFRRKQYTRVGEYIAIHSNILIAMYDEKSEEKEGGTKEIVRKKLTGDYEYFKVIDEDVTYPEDGIVYTIDTPKADNKNKLDYQIKKIFPDGTEVVGLETLEKVKVNILHSIKDYFYKPCIKTNLKDSYNLYTQYHKKIECFNQDVNSHYEDISKKFEKEKLDESNTDIKLLNKNIMMRRSAAYLSGLYQENMQKIEKYISMLIAITTFSLMMKSYSNFEYVAYIDIVYIILIALFFISYQKFKGYKEKQEDYRAISESLRVQIAWNMGNINDSTSLYYLSHQKSDLGWIRTAIRGMKIFYLPKGKNHTINQNMIDKYWLDSQIEYFIKGIKKYSLNEHEITKKMKIYFSLFVFFSIVFTILSYSQISIEKDSKYIFNLTLMDIVQIILVSIPFTITTFLKSKQLFDGNNEILREYKLSLDIFERAKKLLQDDTKNKQNVYKNIGIEALRENSSWIITRRTKEYEVPA